MTDQNIGSQRNATADLDQTAQTPHGHRKITGALAMLLSGEIVGQDMIKFVWDNTVKLLNLTGMSLEPMPEHIAASIFGLLAAVSFYQTKEKE